MTGDTPDTLEYIYFDYYDRVWYYSNSGLGPRYLGIWTIAYNIIGCLIFNNFLIETSKVTLFIMLQIVKNRPLHGATCEDEGVVGHM